MNTPQMYKRVYLHLGRQQTRRYKRSHIAEVLNLAIDDFIQDRYDNIKRQTKYSFERYERIRKELGDIVVYLPTLAPTTPNLFTFPTDLRFTLLAYSTVGGVERLLDISPLDESDREQNDFLKADTFYSYAREVGRTYMVTTAPGTVATNLKLHYIKYLTDIVLNDAVITAGAAVLTIGQKYFVVTGTVTHNAINYTKEQFFTAANTALAGTGQVALYTDTVMPVTSHEEICRRAASALMQEHEHLEKKQGLDVDTAKQ